MLYKSLMAAVLGLAAGSVAQAQNIPGTDIPIRISGAELGAEYNLDIDDRSETTMSFNAGFEIAIGREFAIALTAENLDISEDTTPTTMTLHGIHHLNPNATIGAFYSLSEDEVEGFGIEGGTNLGFADLNGYVGKRTDGTDNAAFLGLGTRSLITDNIRFYTELDIISDNDTHLANGELGVSYTFDEGPEAYVQIGQQGLLDDSFIKDGVTYFGVGARMTFGAQRGTTFETR